MASDTPVVRQIAWLSMIPQLGVMALFMAVAYFAGIELFIPVGALAYVILAILLRRGIAREHRRGMVRVRRSDFAGALPHFERSGEFFARHRWLDDWRFITLMSSSRMSYREMALLNVAFCYGQLGEIGKSRDYYEQVTREFPGSKIAEAVLKLIDGARGSVAKTADP